MKQMTKQVAVIGGGPGGYAAAFLAADLGLDVALIDREPDPGGVCLYRGCIPSKALLHVAKLIGEARQARAWGVEYGEPKIDLDRLRSWKSGVVKKLTSGLGQLSRQRSVSYVRGNATIVDARTLRIEQAGEEPRELKFGHAILATGSRPARIPNLWIDSPRVLDSTTALEIESVPKTLLVIGGGYIGLELGTVYAALGSAVTVVELTQGLLPGADRDLVTVLTRRLESEFRAIVLGARVTSMTEEKDGIKVRLEGPNAGSPEQVFEKVLVAVGRKPNSDVPGLSNTRVKVDARGFIGVNEERRTDEPTIFAIGDVAGEPMLAHKASHEGRVAAEAIAGRRVAFEPQAIPAVVFTDPEIAWCGLTETQAAQEGRTVAIARFPWGASGRALTIDRPDGVTKLVLEPESERVLGVGIAGAGAGELIAEGVTAVEMGATASDLALSIHPHPTLSETIMESAEVFFGQATHLYRKRRA
jgi:dihydrolipoamide dehydrogenase